MTDLVSRFKQLGLPEKKAQQVAKGKEGQSLLNFLDENPSLSHLSPKQAQLCIQLSTDGSHLGSEAKRLILDGITKDQLTSSDQISEAIKYCAANDPIDTKAFEHASGIGVVILPGEIMAIVSQYINSHPEVSDWSCLSKTMTALKARPDLRWAPPLQIKTAIEQAFEAKFGSKLAANKAAAADSKESTAKPKKEESADDLSETRMFEEGFLARLHKPGENPQTASKLTKEHLAFTQGKVLTRFPPEPNGFMHIGHLKALVVNFGYAKHHGGHCYLRYDDTNPTAEKQVYIDGILEMVSWLGFEPFKITFASDHFQRLYDCAVELIKRDKAYVDHSTAEEMKEQRGGEKGGARSPSRWRDRPVQESLDEFVAMQSGKYKKGEAVLRMKMDIQDPNPQMWDLVAYRVVDEPHPRTGSAWRIYPTYDFTHCLNDSFENISHSLCTVEFILSRQSYEWLCDALDLYKARQSEYGRLNIQGAITSKRKLKQLVDENHVSGWDDPRMPTLVGLRRRGVPAGALKMFISSLGVSTTNSTLPYARFEQSIRQYLEVTTPRLMIVLRPIKVILENLPEDFERMIDRPIHPRHPEMGTIQIPFTRVVYIEATDFRTEDSKDYFRMAPGKRVGLLNIERPVICTSFKQDEHGRVTEIIARYDDQGDFVKPKAYIQWVAEHKRLASPIVISEVRMLKPLFTSDNPALVDNFIADLAPDSLEVIRNAYVEIGFTQIAQDALKVAQREAALQAGTLAKAAKTISTIDAQSHAQRKYQPYESVRFQGLRTAYFCLDHKDTKIASVEAGSSNIELASGDKLVMNTIVGLKEDTSKKAAG